jgi:hypothetical protein
MPRDSSFLNASVPPSTSWRTDHVPGTQALSYVYSKASGSSKSAGLPLPLGTVLMDGRIGYVRAVVRTLIVITIFFLTRDRRAIAGERGAHSATRPAEIRFGGHVADSRAPRGQTNNDDDPRRAMALEFLQRGRGQGPTTRASLRDAIDKFRVQQEGGPTVLPLVAGIPVKPRGSFIKWAQRALVQDLSVMVPTWKGLGPDGFGGRTRCLVIAAPPDASVAVDSLHLWAGSAGGGLWESKDGGAQWLPVQGFLGNLSVNALVIDPQNPKVMYAGTGEGFQNDDAVGGDGIYRTTDGEHWYRLASTSGSDFNFVNRLAVSCDGQILIAATNAGMLHSRLPDRLDFKHGRVYGPDAADLTEPMADVKCDPANAAFAIAGGRTTGNAYYSMDGGETWSTARHDQQWLGRVELTYAIHDSKVVYAVACVAMSADDRSGAASLWVSTDRGHNYLRLKALCNGQPLDWLQDQAWYASTLWAYARHRSPDNDSKDLLGTATTGPGAGSGPGAQTDDPNADNVLIVGGVNLWRSVDGGYSFVQINDPDKAKASPHADQHAIIQVPNFHTGGRGLANQFGAYFCTDGGIYRASDIFTVGNGETRTKGWKECNRGFAVAQLYGAATSEISPGKNAIIAGAQDNGTYITRTPDDPTSWTKLAAGDGGYCAADPVAPGHFYSEFQWLQICRGSDNAKFVTDISGVWEELNAQNQVVRKSKDDPYCIPDSLNKQTNFIAPFILDINTPDCILAGGISLWRTRDARARVTATSGPSWEEIKDPIDPSPDISVHAIQAIVIAPGDSNIIFVGHNDGSVYRTTDGTAQRPHWTELGGRGLPAPSRGRPCNRLTFFPNNTQLVVAAFGGYFADNVYCSGDGGEHWSALGRGSLPEVPIYAVTVNPIRDDWLYAATDVGVYASEDRGVTWTLSDQSALVPENAGPTNCVVRDLYWKGHELYAVTHARGLFSIAMVSPPLSSTRPSTNPTRNTESSSAGPQRTKRVSSQICGGITILCDRDYVDSR